MKHSPLFSLACGVLLSASAFGQATAPAPAAPAAPTVRAASDVDLSSKADLSFSYDYYKFESAWAGFRTVQNYWSRTTYDSNPDRNREGALKGGTIAWGKGDWGLIFSYREGDSSIVFDATQAIPGRTPVKFRSTVLFQDEVYDLSLRYNPDIKFGLWQGQMTLGLFQQKTSQNYTFRVTQTGTTPAPATSPVQTRPDLSGDIGQIYGSFGFGLSRSYVPGKDWTFSLKGQALAVAGSADATENSVPAELDAVNAARASEDKTVWGAKGVGTARLAYNVSNSATLALEGGVEYWKFFGIKTVSDKTFGYLGRATIVFRF